MTKKSIIITTSAIVGLIAILTILFGVVFRVRKIDVVYGDDFCYSAQIDDILTASKLRKNKSIFSVERDIVATNIEQAYPYARVEGVNVTSFTSVKIKLSNREPLYYLVEEAVYYILDEDCKVLEITNDSALATKYILLTDVFSVSESTKVGQFLSNKYTSVCKGLYNALYSNAVLNIGEDTDNDGEADKKYLDRNDMCEIISSIKFTQVDELNGRVDKLVMSTSYGTSISIIEPKKELDLKINMAFSALRVLIERGNNEQASGTIQVRYSYDENNVPSLKCEYIA
ncbi:MAG: hypothetical protein IJ358_00465 [Clostridia bacterium]|nr:hypothetical protein [Clostridia bacterium]